jgi:hypothetical protein
MINNDLARVQLDVYLDMLDIFDGKYVLYNSQNPEKIARVGIVKIAEELYIVIEIR